MAQTGYQEVDDESLGQKNREACASRVIIFIKDFISQTNPSPDPYCLEKA